MLRQNGVLGNGLVKKDCVTNAESGFITTLQ